MIQILITNYAIAISYIICIPVIIFTCFMILKAAIVREKRLLNIEALLLKALKETEELKQELKL